MQRAIRAHGTDSGHWKVPGAQTVGDLPTQTEVTCEETGVYSPAGVHLSLAPREAPTAPRESQGGQEEAT